VTDRRQRLDGEIEVGERPVALGIGNRLMAEPIKEGKDGVERNEQRGRAAEKHRPVDRHRPMVEIGPETLAQAESLDLPVTELEELRLFPCALAPKFWQCVTASILRSFPRKRESSRRHYSRARPRWIPAFGGRADTVRIETTATPQLSA